MNRLVSQTQARSSRHIHCHNAIFSRKPCSHVSAIARLMGSRIWPTGHFVGSVQNKSTELGLGSSATLNSSYCSNLSNIHHLRVFSEPFEMWPMPALHIVRTTVKNPCDLLKYILWFRLSLSAAHSNALCRGCTVIGAVLFGLRYLRRQRMPDKRNFLIA